MKVAGLDFYFLQQRITKRHSKGRTILLINTWYFLRKYVSKNFSKPS
jgi:hypothetical protein